MSDFGVYNLGSAVISAAVTNEVITSGVDGAGVAREYIGDLDGITALTVGATFNYGAGGTSVKVDVETSFDQGASWWNIGRFAFTTSSAQKVLNLSGLTAITSAAAPPTPTDDTGTGGILGDRFRAKITSTGTYTTNTNVAVWMAAR